MPGFERTRAGAFFTRQVGKVMSAIDILTRSAPADVLKGYDRDTAHAGGLGGGSRSASSTTTQCFGREPELVLR
jgi:hypothetical protein